MCLYTYIDSVDFIHVWTICYVHCGDTGYDKSLRRYTSYSIGYRLSTYYQFITAIFTSLKADFFLPLSRIPFYNIAVVVFLLFFFSLVSFTSHWYIFFFYRRRVAWTEWHYKRFGFCWYDRRVPKHAYDFIDRFILCIRTRHSIAVEWSGLEPFPVVSRKYP